ncbi:MAG: T9SS type A sorting domain-containing protein [Bacteroidales bacterium]|nr:T9SS type A sorting domain-containing protein [Bacteroidales bacterium]
MNRFLTIVLLLISFSLSAQDTLIMMHYNLLNYGNDYGGCDQSTNYLGDKDEYLKTIIPYINPDILTVNEIDCSSTIADRLLDNTLNVNGISHFQRAEQTCYSTPWIGNMLYYNSTKLGLHSQDVVTTNIRDINLYKLYYNSSDLPVTNDTAFIICICTHLKAGSYPENLVERADETSRLMNYLDDIGIADNYIFSGDFNTRSSSEESFQNLVNHSNPDIRFYDPINQLGTWHDNSSYKNIHTQSTHTSTNGCPSSGGLDDRYDFILISDNIKTGIDNVEYLDDSYQAIGQDGEHFNGALNSSPANTSVPADVLEALYRMSDHLPIVINLKVDKTLSIEEIQKDNFADISFTNPVNRNLSFSIKFKTKPENFKVEVISLLGKQIYSQNFNTSGINFKNTISLNNLKKGFYFLRISDGNRRCLVKKFVKY